MKHHVIIGIPRWFIINRPPQNVKCLSIDILKSHGCVFLPFPAKCARKRSTITCNYENLKDHEKLSETLFNKYGGLLKYIAIHTEYEAPIWFDKEFVERYIEATLNLANLALRMCKALKVIEIELHPGFSSYQGGRRPWNPIIEGMVNYISYINEHLNRYGIKLKVTVENRGSSSLSKPQAAARLDELINFRTALEHELRRKHIDIEAGLTIDPLQLLSLKLSLKDIQDNIEHLVKEHGQLVHSIHIHWISGKGKRHCPPPPEDFDRIIKWFKKIINYVIDLKGKPYVVPEIVPYYLGRKETLKLLKNLQMLSKSM